MIIYVSDTISSLTHSNTPIILRFKHEMLASLFLRPFCILPFTFEVILGQTCDLSKILDCRIFRPKLLHRQFYQFNCFSDKTQKMSENGEIYTVYTAAGSDGRDKSHIYMGGHKNIYI